MSREGECLIWGSKAEIADPDGRDGTVVSSTRAGGRYFITCTATAMIGKCSEHQKARLTTWLIDQRRLGVDCPEIASNTINDAVHDYPIPVHVRTDRLLQFLESRQEHIGAWIPTEVTNTAENLYGEGHTVIGGELLAHTESVKPVEVQYLLEQLEIKRFLDVQKNENLPVVHTITVDGYAHLAELQESAVDSQRAFVAMWFDPSLLEAWEKGIEPGVRDAGYLPVRIDREEHNNKIDDGSAMYFSIST